MNVFIVALASILLSVLAQFSLKAGMSSETVRAALAEPFAFSTGLKVLTHPGVFAGFLLYGLGAVVWLAVLSRWEVSKAYPLVGLGFVLTASVGWFLGENVTTLRMLGVTLVCAGIVCVASS